MFDRLWMHLCIYNIALALFVKKHFKVVNRLPACFSLKSVHWQIDLSAKMVLVFFLARFLDCFVPPVYLYFRWKITSWSTIGCNKTVFFPFPLNHCFEIWVWAVSLGYLFWIHESTIIILILALRAAKLTSIGLPGCSRQLKTLSQDNVLRPGLCTCPFLQNSWRVTRANDDNEGV